MACGLANNKPPAKGRPFPLVTTFRVETRDVPVLVRGPVDLKPIAQADVGSKSLGYLDAVLVDRGDPVKKGQLLALVRPSDLPDQLSAAKSAVAQAEASAALARGNYERAQKLSPSGVISQQELQAAASAQATTSAAESVAKAQLGALAVRLGETRLEAPLDGVVLFRRLDPGALVGPSAGPILTVARTDVMRVFVAVNERNAAAIAVGQTAKVEVDAFPGKVFSGEVVRFAPAFDATTRTLDVEVRLDNRENLLRPGMYGRAAILTGVHPESVVVPVESVQLTEDRRYVFVVGASGDGGFQVSRRRVELGEDLEDFLEITSGVDGGEEIVRAGIDGLSDGAKVRVKRGEAGPGPLLPGQLP